MNEEMIKKILEEWRKDWPQFANDESYSEGVELWLIGVIHQVRQEAVVEARKCTGVFHWVDDCGMCDCDVEPVEALQELLEPSTNK